jgi:hypothetical protein
MTCRVENVLVSLDHRTQGVQGEIGSTTTLIATTWRGLNAKIAEVTCDFLEELEITTREFKADLEAVEALGAHQSSERANVPPLNPGPNAVLSENRDRSRRGAVVCIRRMYLLGCVPAAFRDQGGTQLQDERRKGRISDSRHEEACCTHGTSVPVGPTCEEVIITPCSAEEKGPTRGESL